MNDILHKSDGVSIFLMFIGILLILVKIIGGGNYLNTPITGFDIIGITGLFLCVMGMFFYFTPIGFIFVDFIGNKTKGKKTTNEPEYLKRGVK